MKSRVVQDSPWWSLDTSGAGDDEMNGWDLDGWIWWAQTWSLEVIKLGVGVVEEGRDRFTLNWQRAERRGGLKVDSDDMIG